MKQKLNITVTLVAALMGLAAVSRYELPLVETRFQMLAFWMLAVFVEKVVKPKFGLKPSWLVVAVTGMCTTGVILAVRWHIEGLCPHTWPQCPSPLSAVEKLIRRQIVPSV